MGRELAQAWADPGRLGNVPIHFLAVTRSHTGHGTANIRIYGLGPGTPTGTPPGQPPLRRRTHSRDRATSAAKVSATEDENPP